MTGCFGLHILFMTILDKISKARQEFTAAAGDTPDTLCLGNLEQRAYIAAIKQIFQLNPDMNSMKSGNTVFEGMVVLPVDMPSYLAVGSMMVTVDNNVK